MIEKISSSHALSDNTLGEFIQARKLRFAGDQMFSEKPCDIPAKRLVGVQIRERKVVVHKHVNQDPKRFFSLPVERLLVLVEGDKHKTMWGVSREDYFVAKIEDTYVLGKGIYFGKSDDFERIAAGITESMEEDLAKNLVKVKISPFVSCLPLVAQGFSWVAQPMVKNKNATFKYSNLPSAAQRVADLIVTSKQSDRVNPLVMTGSDKRKYIFVALNSRVYAVCQSKIDIQHIDGKWRMGRVDINQIPSVTFAQSPDGHRDADNQYEVLTDVAANRRIKDVPRKDYKPGYFQYLEGFPLIKENGKSIAHPTQPRKWG